MKLNPLFALVVCAVSAAPVWAIGTPPAEREAIRKMELLNRPDRPGHFYGNNVRRVHRLFESRASRGGRVSARAAHGMEAVDWRLVK